MSLTCYACTIELHSLNQSQEHVIPNSIGGKLKSNELLCKSCNNNFGSSHEAEFAEQLKFFSGRLPIKRDRGTNRKYNTIDKASGLPVVIDDSGKVTLAHVVMLEKPDSEKGGRLRFLAPDEASAKEVVERYREKFPKAKIDIMTSEPEDLPQEKKPIEVLGGFGSTSFFKTAQKCFLNLYALEGGAREYIYNEARELFTSDSEPRIWLYSDDDLKSANKLFHTIAVIGRPEEKILFGYAEFFGGIRLIGILNDNYIGSPVYFTHSIDPLQGQIHKCDVSVGLSRDQIVNLVTEKSFNSEEISKQLDNTESAIKSTHYFSNIIQRAMDKTLEKNEIITPEMINELTAEIVKSLTPNILAAAEKRREEAEKAFRKELEDRKNNK